MTEHRLLPIAEISRHLNLPESTLHYWKNRFSEYLPSIGDGRQRRFRSESLGVFKSISDLLALGLSTKDVKAELGRLYPLNIDTNAGRQAVATFLPDHGASGFPAPPMPVQMGAEVGAQMAVQIGAEIARAIGETLRQFLPAGGGHAPADVQAIQERVEAAGQAAEATSAEVGRLRTENDDLRGRLAVMEQELVRLRKDRREMEKFLLEKINGLRRE